MDTRTGRVDLLYDKVDGNVVVVEIKLDKIGRKAINQLRGYMKEVKEDLKINVSGIIICKGIMPAFEEEFANLKNIKIYNYGWRFGLNPWHSTLE